MKHRNSWIALAMMAVLPLAGCGKAQVETAVAAVRPAVVAPTGDTGISRITLTDQAMKRLGLQFALVVADGQGLALPYSALVYDPSGGEWVYANTGLKAFQRISVKVERIDGGKMYLSKGPAAGTSVVTVGAEELFGAEFEIGH
jgi:hypothetical protein